MFQIYSDLLVETQYTEALRCRGYGPASVCTLASLPLDPFLDLTLSRCRQTALVESLVVQVTAL